LFKDGVLIPRNINGSNNRCSRWFWNSFYE
jgi:hypothetical protein